MNYRSRCKGTKYAGAKARCAPGIVPVINGLLPAGGVFWDCFCGSGKIVQSVRRDCKRIATDLDPHIIELLRQIQGGWVPPPEVPESEYVKWRDMARRLRRTGTGTTSHPMIGFVGYACSFGGKFFAGYARSTRPRNDYCGEGRRALLRQKPFLRGVVFRTQGYDRGCPGGNVPDVIYCDPPYAGTIRVGSTRSVFDSKQFWDWAVVQARSSTVLVSEYTCPVPGAVVLWERRLSGAGGLRSKDKAQRVEKLFCLSRKVRGRVGFGFA